MTDALRPTADVSSADQERLEPARLPRPAAETRGRDRHGKVWLWWVAATVAGNVVAGVLVAALLLREPGRLSLAPVVGMGGLAAVAVLQWLVLRRDLPRVRWWSWMLAAILGQIVGGVVVALTVMGSIFLGALRQVVQSMSAPALQTATTLVTGALLGAAVGFAQWIVLRRHLVAAAWWIAAAALGGALAAIVPTIAGMGFAPGGPAAQIVSRLGTGLVVGCITGVALVWLLERTRAAAGDWTARSHPPPAPGFIPKLNEP